MRIHCVQMDIAWEDKPANFQKVRALLSQAKVPSGGLILLPEMFATGFSMNSRDIAEPPSGRTETFLAHLAQEFGCAVVGGLVLQSADRGARNCAVVISPGGFLTATYAKIHLFSPGHETNFYFPGEQVVTFACGSLKAAPFICYDLRFPEVFREACRLGANFFFVLANWPSSRGQHWLTLLRARAIENQAWVAGVNRVGRDPRNDYSGQSVVINPRGEVVAEGGSTEGVVSADVDLQTVLKWREEFPVLNDIRVR